MKARGAYRLIVSRGGRGPVWLAGPNRVDHVEIVDVDSGEVVLFWDLPAHAASRMARMLREDLSQLEADAFIARWSAVEQEAVER